MSLLPAHSVQAGWPGFQQQLEGFLVEGAWWDPLLQPRALRAAQELLLLGYKPLSPKLVLWRKVGAAASNRPRRECLQA